MFALQHFSSESTTIADPDSGCTIRRLTSGIGHSHSLYFTCESWTSDSRYIIGARERAETGNQLVAFDTTIGDIAQLTDLPGTDTIRHIYNYASLSPVGEVLVFWHQNTLWRLDVTNGDRHSLWQCPAGYRVQGTSVNADGSVVFTTISQDLSHSFGARDGTNMAAEKPIMRLSRIRGSWPFIWILVLPPCCGRKPIKLRM